METTSHKHIRKIADYHWANEKFSEYATLCFVFRKNEKEEREVLLIHKKRGLGKGLINAPGGRIDPHESDIDCAIRETQEEVCITPKNSRKVGELNFLFTNGYTLKGYVFVAGEFEGEIKETDEALPFWCKTDEIPYKNMWADDEFWVPEMLKNRRFSGYFIFDDETMLDKKIVVDEKLTLEYNKTWHNTLR